MIVTGNTSQPIGNSETGKKRKFDLTKCETANQCSSPVKKDVDGTAESSETQPVKEDPEEPSPVKNNSDSSEDDLRHVKRKKKALNNKST